MEWLELVKNISIIIALFVAIYGIDAWRREHVGKRQLELAEDTLSLFYEASDAISHIRHPASYEHESRDAQRGEDESEAEYKARKNAFVVFYRYNEYQELFSKIHASRYRFMAQVGKKEAAPFEDLRLVINEIKFSARRLSRLWAENNHSTRDEKIKHRERLRKYEAIFWDDMEENDPINPKLEKIIRDIEYTCKSIIAGKGTLYGILNRKI